MALFFAESTQTLYQGKKELIVDEALARGGIEVSETNEDLSGQSLRRANGIIGPVENLPYFFSRDSRQIFQGTFDTTHATNSDLVEIRQTISYPTTMSF